MSTRKKESTRSHHSPTSDMIVHQAFLNIDRSGFPKYEHTDHDLVQMWKKAHGVERLTDTALAG